MGGCYGNQIVQMVYRSGAHALRTTSAIFRGDFYAFIYIFFLGGGGGGGEMNGKRWTRAYL